MFVWIFVVIGLNIDNTIYPEVEEEHPEAEEPSGSKTLGKSSFYLKLLNNLFFFIFVYMKSLPIQEYLHSYIQVNHIIYHEYHMNILQGITCKWLALFTSS